MPRGLCRPRKCGGGGGGGWVCWGPHTLGPRPPTPAAAATAKWLWHGGAIVAEAATIIMGTATVMRRAL